MREIIADIYIHRLIRAQKRMYKYRKECSPAEIDGGVTDTDLCRRWEREREKREIGSYLGRLKCWLGLGPKRIISSNHLKWVKDIWASIKPNFFALRNGVVLTSNHRIGDLWTGQFRDFRSLNDAVFVRTLVSNDSCCLHLGKLFFFPFKISSNLFPPNMASPLQCRWIS